MASPTTALTILYGFSVVFISLCWPQLLGIATTDQASPWGLERLAATAFFPAILVTLAVTPLLLHAHVRSLGRANAGAGAGGHLVASLAKATVLAAATLALLAGAVLHLGADGAVVQIGADGHLDRGRGDVARLNIKWLQACSGTPCCCRTRRHLDESDL